MTITTSETPRATKVCAVDARIIRRSTPCREHVELECVLPRFPDSCAGQFVQILCQDAVETSARVREWEDDAFRMTQGVYGGSGVLLRRPFSIADRWDEPDGAHLVFISRRVGPGTAWLERRQAGDVLNLTGPLGRGFVVPAANETGRPILLVGGGVGIPPLLYMARQLVVQGFEDVTAVFGATTRELLAVELISQPDREGRATRCLRLPGAAPFGAIVTTDDGTLGIRGVVTAGMEAWARSRSRDERTLVLACGPERMLTAVAELTRRRGWACQVCIEKTMGCGLGTCLSCVVRVRDVSREGGWRWALSCTEGPVFERDALVEMGLPEQT